jgi:Protein of unknown function (DUF2934)
MKEHEIQTSSSDHVKEMDEAVPEQRIRERAYQIYQQRGAKGGHADGDWLTAEAELKEVKKKVLHLARVCDSLTS